MTMQNPPDYRHDTVLPLPMEVTANAWAVDAACSGNPGPMEYQAIDLATGAQVFHFGPMHGTNNIGEFLAIVHALALLDKQGIEACEVNAVYAVSQFLNGRTVVSEVGGDVELEVACLHRCTVEHELDTGVVDLASVHPLLCPRRRSVYEHSLVLGRIIIIGEVEA